MDKKNTETLERLQEKLNMLSEFVDNKKKLTKEDLNYKERKMEDQTNYNTVLGPSKDNPPNMDRYKMSPTGFANTLDWVDVSKLHNNGTQANQIDLSASYINGLFNDYNNYTPYQSYYYYAYPTVIYEDKTKKSFELVKKLMDKGLMQEPKTIKDFIELVTKVSNLI